MGGQPAGADGHGVWRLTIYRVGTPITLTDVLPRLQHMGVDVVDEHPYEFAGPLAQPFWIYDFGLRRTGVGAAGNEPVTGQFPAVAPERGSRAGQGAVRGRADRAVAGQDRGRRLQRPGPRRAPDLAPDRGAARLRQVPAAGRDPRSASATSSGCCLQHDGHPAAGPAVRVPVRPGAGRRARPSGARPSRRRSAALLDEVAVLDHDRILRAYLGADPGHPAHQLFPRQRPVRGAAGHRRARRTWCSSWTRPRCRTCPTPRPQFEAVRLLAAAGGRAPAVRAGRPGRAALVGPAGGLPHRDPGAGQGAGGEELGHRPVRGQGRLRLQAAARPGRPRGLPGRGARLLQDVHQRHAGHHRQPARRPGGAAAAAWSGTTATTRTWWWPRTRAPPRSPTRPTRSPQAYGYWLGDAFASGGSEGYDHKKMGDHRPRRVGVGQVPLRHARRGRRRPRTSPWPGSATCPATCSATGCCCREHIKLVAAFDHRHIFLDPDPDPAAQLRRTAAAVRAAPLLVGRLRPRADLRGRRGVAAHARSRSRCPRRPPGARARTSDGARAVHRTS